jgi:hypothetical protein
MASTTAETIMDRLADIDGLSIGISSSPAQTVETISDNATSVANLNDFIECTCR